MKALDEVRAFQKRDRAKHKAGKLSALRGMVKPRAVSIEQRACIAALKAAHGMIETALNDAQRGDRVDCADLIRLARLELTVAMVNINKSLKKAGLR